MPTEDGTYKVVKPFIREEEEEEESSSIESTTEQTNSPTADESTSSDQYDDDETLGDDWDDDTEESEQETDEQDEPDESEDTVETDQSEESTDDEETAEEQAQDESSDDQPQSKAEKRKEQLNTEIRDLVSERNRIKQEVEQLNSQYYQPATVDQLIEQENPETGDYFTRMEAEIAVMKQREQLRDYNEKVSESRLQLRSDAERALRDFPMFNSESPEYNESLAKQAEALINPNLVFDPNTNQLIGSRVSPYDVYKTLNDSYSIASTKSQVKAQKATEKMLSNADPSPGAHNKPAPKDAGIDAFDQEANRW